MRGVKIAREIVHLRDVRSGSRKFVSVRYEL